MKVARTLVMADEAERAWPGDFGLVVFVKSEDELWRHLLAWHAFPALEGFTFRAYLANFTLVVCPRGVPKKRFRRLKREIALETFSYPIKVVRGFPAEEPSEIFRKEDFKRSFLQALWRRAYELAEGREMAFELLRHRLKRCPFCEKESLEVIDELAEFKRKLRQVPEDQRPRFIFGFFGLLLRCASCKEALFWQPQRHFYRFSVEYILKTCCPSAATAPSTGRA